MKNAARAFVTVLVILACGVTTLAHPKTGRLLKARAAKGKSWSRVIVRTKNGSSVSDAEQHVAQKGGAVGRRLHLINGFVALLPMSAIDELENDPDIEQLFYDRLVVSANERTGATVGATAVRALDGYDGSGIGVAVIDSGVNMWHDDLSSAGNNNRVVHFVDFVNGQQNAYDDYGHGSHVAGIIGGNGFDSTGARTGMAPGVSLIVLKALDASGQGRISDVIAALEYSVANKDALNIRVVNLSIATPIYESYDTDPLTLAAKQVVDAGIVVVAAAGNRGKSPDGFPQYGGITSPGNAPWVLTVGASSHQGTVDRADDTMGAFSSRGPSAVDYGAKPDLVAPGVGIESLSAPGSTMYTNLPGALLSGTVNTPYLPYLSLSGTSMATPVVSGVVALMLQANPALTPNLVKAILQYTAERYPKYDPMTEGAGFLDAQGAVALAKFLANPEGLPYPASPNWSAHLIWGNQELTGGRLTAAASAWSADVTWGDALTTDGQNVAWGQSCAEDDCGSATETPWKSTCADEMCSDFQWGDHAKNVVWSSLCGGTNCTGDWSPSGLVLSDGTKLLWGTTVVWGTTTVFGATVVWGTSDDDGDTVVWGTSDLDTVVWGTSDDGDTVVWGTNCSDPACEPMIWGR